MQVLPNHVQYLRPPTKLHNRSIIPPHAHQTSHLQLTAYRVDDNADSSSSDSSPTPGTSMPVSKGTRGMSFLYTLAKHYASNSLLIMPSSDSSPTLGTSIPVPKGTRGTSFLCLQKRYYFCSVSQLSLCSELSTQSLLQLLHTEPILILSSATSSLAFHLMYFYTG